MRFAALFLWLLGPLASYAVYQSYGSPHALWSYRFIDNGEPHNPYAYRQYTSCTYVGWGLETVTTGDKGGKCPWVRLLNPPL